MVCREGSWERTAQRWTFQSGKPRGEEESGHWGEGVQRWGQGGIGVALTLHQPLLEAGLHLAL